MLMVRRSCSIYWHDDSDADTDDNNATVFPLLSQAELDLRVSQDQVSALKKHNAQLACRCREEAKAKLKEHDERVETQDKVRRKSSKTDTVEAASLQSRFNRVLICALSLFLSLALSTTHGCTFSLDIVDVYLFIGAARNYGFPLRW